jgi:hypothetical protein
MAEEDTTEPTKYCKFCDSHKPTSTFQKERYKDRFVYRTKCCICRNVDQNRRHRKRHPPIPKSKRTREQRLAYKNQWYAANKEKIAAAQKERRCRLKANFARVNQNWRLNNPEKCRTYVRNRRARIRNCQGSHTDEDVANIYKLQKGKCAGCNKPLGDKYDVDHIKPLIQGGENNPRNLQLMHAYCNRSKGAKDPIQFMQEKGFLL